VSKRGLPAGVQMRHDAHYVDILSAPSKTIGRKIAIDLIVPNPAQPRTEFGDLSELTASISEKGVLEPLLVKPGAASGKWMIIAGERRWRASKLAGLTEVPCIEMDLDEQGVAEIALIENLQRKDLNVWEEADGLASLASKFGYTQEQIAKKISKSRTTVTELMSIAGLPETIRNRVRTAGITSKSALLELARQFDENAMHELLDGQMNPTARPASIRARAGKKPPASYASASPNESKTVEYVYIGDDFKLEISFTDGGDCNRNRVLRSLKQVFEAVKSDTSA